MDDHLDRSSKGLDSPMPGVSRLLDAGSAIRHLV